MRHHIEKIIEELKTIEAIPGAAKVMKEPQAYTRVLLLIAAKLEEITVKLDRMGGRGV